MGHLFPWLLSKKLKAPRGGSASLSGWKKIGELYDWGQAFLWGLEAKRGPTEDPREPTWPIKGPRPRTSCPLGLIHKSTLAGFFLPLLINEVAHTGPTVQPFFFFSVYCLRHEKGFLFRTAGTMFLDFFFFLWENGGTGELTDVIKVVRSWGPAYPPWRYQNWP
jgi:hypothetical protein